MGESLVYLSSGSKRRDGARLDTDAARRLSATLAEALAAASVASRRRRDGRLLERAEEARRLAAALAAALSASDASSSFAEQL